LRCGVPAHSQFLLSEKWVAIRISYHQRRLTLRRLQFSPGFTILFMARRIPAA
jgi:hypothetical protein